jgi:glutamate transport system substrate-binding protein
MKTIKLAAAVAAGALALSLTACGGDSPSAAGPTVANKPTFEAGTTMARVAEAGKINIGTKFDQPLFGLKGLDGKPAGFDVEIAKIIAGELGITPENINWTETPSKVRDEFIAQGKVDLITATYAITAPRKERVTFGGPYYLAGSKIMVKKDNSDITGPDSFKDGKHKVCTTAGAIDAEALKPYLGDPGQLVQFDVFSKCADALRTGQVDSVAADSATLLGLVSASQDQFKVVGKAFLDQPYGVGIKKGDIKFCEFVNKTLKAAEADGRYAAAWTSTAGVAEKEVPKLPELGPCA